MDAGAAPVIQLNGQPHPLPGPASVSGLLTSLGMADIPVLVEHNGTALFPREFASTQLQDGDRVELIRITAGG